MIKFHHFFYFFYIFLFFHSFLLFYTIDNKVSIIDTSYFNNTQNVESLLEKFPISQDINDYDNKYDHIYIKLEYISNLNQFNFIKEKLMSWKNISKFKKFKLKRT